jgi:hypothetical protein
LRALFFNRIPRLSTTSCSKLSRKVTRECSLYSPSVATARCEDVLIEGDMQPLSLHVHFVDADDDQPNPRKAALKLPEPQEDDF